MATASNEAIGGRGRTTSIVRSGDGIGQGTLQPTIPTLARLCRECALVPVREGSRALFDMRLEEAWRAVEAMIERSDRVGSPGLKNLPSGFVEGLRPLRTFVQEGRTGARVMRQALSFLAPCQGRERSANSDLARPARTRLAQTGSSLVRSMCSPAQR